MCKLVHITGLHVQYKLQMVFPEQTYENASRGRPLGEDYEEKATRCHFSGRSRFALYSCNCIFSFAASGMSRARVGFLLAFSFNNSPQVKDCALVDSWLRCTSLSPSPGPAKMPSSRDVTRGGRGKKWGKRYLTMEKGEEKEREIIK